jgi:hypothetical protein
MGTEYLLGYAVRRLQKSYAVEGNGRQFMREIAHGTGTRADEMLGRPVSQYAALCRSVAKGYEAYHWT